MEHSESIAKLAAALAAFQAEVKDPSRDGQNPHFRSKYVQIDGLLAAVRPMLAKNGLSIVQSTGGNGQDISVTTEIMHTSGEWIRTDALMIKPAKADPQGCMSAITYSRRYSLSAALGVAWDDDDDGEAASEKPKAKAKKSNKDASLQALKAEMATHKISADDMKVIIPMKYNKKSWADLTDEEAADMAANVASYAVEMIEREDAKLMEDIPM